MKDAEKFWDFLAKNYDRPGEDESGRQDLPVIRRFLQPDDLVFEYACGSGTLALMLAPQVREIHAIDVSSRMLALAQEKAASSRVENIRFIQATIDDDRCPTGPFTVALAFNILHLLANPQRALERINQLLQPSGILISNTPCLGEQMIFANRLLVPLVLLSSKIKLIPPVQVFKATSLERLICSAGFQILETEDYYEGNLSHLVVARKL
jgi:ubiquinone/menaquinone biosynthesis C-methylase UbiE